MKIRQLLCFLVMPSLGLSAGGYGNTGTSTTAKQAPAVAATDEETTVIPGIVIERKSGNGFLGLELVDYKYKLSFYGEDKKLQKADFPRALLRWPRKGRSGTERYLLSVGSEGNSLTSPRDVKPPYNYRLFIVLLDDDPETDAETYVVQFRP